MYMPRLPLRPYLFSGDQFVALATAVQVPRCGARSNAGLLSPSLVSGELGPRWIAGTARMVTLYLSPADTGCTTTAQRGDDYADPQRPRIVCFGVSCTLGVSVRPFVVPSGVAHTVLGWINDRTFVGHSTRRGLCVSSRSSSSSSSSLGASREGEGCFEALLVDSEGSRVGIISPCVVNAKWIVGIEMENMLLWKVDNPAASLEDSLPASRRCKVVHIRDRDSFYNLAAVQFTRHVPWGFRDGDLLSLCFWGYYMQVDLEATYKSGKAEVIFSASDVAQAVGPKSLVFSRTHGELVVSYRSVTHVRTGLNQTFSDGLRIGVGDFHIGAASVWPLVKPGFEVFHVDDIALSNPVAVLGNHVFTTSARIDLTGCAGGLFLQCASSWDNPGFIRIIDTLTGSNKKKFTVHQNLERKVPVTSLMESAIMSMTPEISCAPPVSTEPLTPSQFKNSAISGGAQLISSVMDIIADSMRELITYNNKLQEQNRGGTPHMFCGL
ncbi:hypothetical protein Pelo_18297 [Pelomyxa schiedti]|nr:hypothetical protein Pelo_18297 [Pelomyxa schiedti]